ncbi:ATP-dependent Clp protease ATP-binding subunit [Candidatus Uhrbacteria bacterium]|nr:ATP-dependent Clp protease ATP-binding subunit [Candidatus Uhrbacteria bacterium]
MQDKVEKVSESDILSNLPFVATSAERPHDFGVLVDDSFYYWDARLDSSSRKLRKLRDQINKLITLFSVVVTSLLLILFVLSTFILLPSSTWGALEYWTAPSVEQMFLWLGVGGLLYIGYRRALARREPKETGDRVVVETKPVRTTWEAADGMGHAKWINLPARSSLGTWEGLDSAATLAEQFKHPYVSMYHIFAGMLSQPSVGHIFSRLGITFEDIKDSLSKKLNEIPAAREGQAVSAAIDALGQRTILGAAVHARTAGRTVITPVDMFISSYRNSEFLREVFYGIGIEDEAMENVLAWLQIREQMRARWQAFRSASAFKPKGNMNRSMTAVATPLLDRVSDDLTSMAVRGGLPLLVGREEEMARILRVFEGGGRSVVLVGPPGVGKQAMIDGISELMVREDVPDMLKDRRLVSFDIGRLVAGATPSQAEERLLLALNEVARSRNIALAILDIDDIVGISSGGAESLDLSSLLAREIEKGYFVLVSTTTPDAYRSTIEGSSLGNVLTKVEIDEPDKNLSIKIVEAKVGRAEAEHNVIFSYQAVEAAVELTGRFMHDAYLPQKAIEVIEEVALSVKQSKGVGSTVTKDDVAAIVSAASKVPLTSVTQDEKTKLLTLETEMHNRVIGQDEAVQMVSSALRRARTELRSGGRPIANFLFLGPTGVGKTELAKTIAETYFGNEEAMVRLDMSEYQAPGSIDRLLGIPGSGQGGIFTEAVRQQPFGLILLDELEKAHPDILNVFLQVFDDGQLTDAAGRVIDFTQTIIVATSNAGSQYIQAEVKKQTPMDIIKTHLIETELAQHYRPEFLNRFDGVVVFTPLTMEDVMAIARLMLASVISRMDDKGIVFEVSDAALKELAVAGYDPQFGARPLRRVIQEKVEDPLATSLLEGNVARRDKIILDAGGAMRVEKAAEL